MAKHKQNKVKINNLQEQLQDCPHANFLQRMGAYLYDLVVITALLMLATLMALLVTTISDKIGLIDLSAYSDIADYLSHSLLFAGYLAAVIIAFYGYFWSHGGQTIGMKAWRLRVQNSDGSDINFTQALIRMATSAFGLGTIAAIFTNRNAFQDLWAECEVIVLPKELNNWKGFKGLTFMKQDKK